MRRSKPRAQRAVGARRSEADRARHEHRRHCRRLPPAEDPQGRSHGRVHARGRAGQRRSASSFRRPISGRPACSRSARWCSCGASSNETMSRCASWRRRCCRSTRVAERLAREVAIRVRMPADRGVFEALGEVFQRHRGDRRVSFEMELASGPTPMRVRADVSAQIRVKPSPALVAEVEHIVGAGRGVAAMNRRDRSSGIVIRSSIRLAVTNDDQSAPMAEPLEFEEPIAALLKEIDALAELPQTDAPRSADRDPAPAHRDGARRALCRPDAVAARARRQASGASQPRGLHPAAVHRLCRDSRRSAVRRRPRDHDRICRLQGPAGPARRPCQGRRHEGKDLSQFRLRAARRAIARRCGRCGWRRNFAGRSSSSSTRRPRIRASSPRSAASPRRLPSTCAR